MGHNSLRFQRRWKADGRFGLYSSLLVACWDPEANTAIVFYLLAIHVMMLGLMNAAPLSVVVGCDDNRSWNSP